MMELRGVLKRLLPRRMSGVASGLELRVERLLFLRTPLGRVARAAHPQVQCEQLMLRELSGMGAGVRKLGFGGAAWRAHPPLGRERMRNCELVLNRYRLLEMLPKGGVCGEIGIARGDYSARILAAAEPRELHLFDKYGWSISNARARFAAEVRAGRVVVHAGDSSSCVNALGDVRFDWVYIDGDHSYEGCARDLAAVRPRMRAGGLILLDDYVPFALREFKKFGVMAAVHDFCREHDYELAYMTLSTNYTNVAIRPMGGK